MNTIIIVLFVKPDYIKSPTYGQLTTVSLLVKTTLKCIITLKTPIQLFL